MQPLLLHQTVIDLTGVSTITKDAVSIIPLSVCGFLNYGAKVYSIAQENTLIQVKDKLLKIVCLDGLIVLLLSIA